MSDRGQQLAGVSAVVFVGAIVAILAWGQTPPRDAELTFEAATALRNCAGLSDKLNDPPEDRRKLYLAADAARRECGVAEGEAYGTSCLVFAARRQDLAMLVRDAAFAPTAMNSSKVSAARALVRESSCKAAGL